MICDVWLVWRRKLKNTEGIANEYIKNQINFFHYLIKENIHLVFFIFKAISDPTLDQCKEESKLQILNLSPTYKDIGLHFWWIPY